MHRVGSRRRVIPPVDPLNPNDDVAAPFACVEIAAWADDYNRERTH